MFSIILWKGMSILFLRFSVLQDLSIQINWLILIILNSILIFFTCWSNKSVILRNYWETREKDLSTDQDFITGPVHSLQGGIIVLRDPNISGIVPKQIYHYHKVPYRIRWQTRFFELSWQCQSGCPSRFSFIIKCRTKSDAGQDFQSSLSAAPNQMIG